MTQTFRHFDSPVTLISQMVGRGVSPDGLRFVTHSGAVILCPNRPGARVPVYEVFAEDAYRLNSLVAELPADFVAVDIGAHIGCFSVALARLTPGARIRAFEASPSTAEWLQRNVTENALDGRVEVHPTAVSDRSGTMLFADNGQGSSLNGVTAPEGTSKVLIPTTTMRDALISEGAPADLVKIDTEGAEYDMILASEAEDWASVQQVVMEYHDVPGHDWSELHRFFEAAGFRLVAREETTPRHGTCWLSRLESPTL